MQIEDEFFRAELKRLTHSVDRLTDTIVNLERRMAETYVRQDVYERDRELDELAGRNLSEKVHALTSIRDWAIKLIVGAVILALLGLVLVSNGGAPS